jgi:L-fucose isomerase
METGWDIKRWGYHLINSGSCTLDGTGEQTDEDGNPVMKPFWEITEEEVNKNAECNDLAPASLEIYARRRLFFQFLTKGGMPVTMCRINLIKGLGPVMQ